MGKLIMKKVKTEKEISFRIVKERWYHKFLDTLEKKIFKLGNYYGKADYQIHLSAYLIKKINSWVLYKHNQETYKLTPEISPHRAWCKENINDEQNTFRSTGFEMDMSDTSCLTEQKKQENREKQEKQKRKVYTEEEIVTLKEFDNVLKTLTIDDFNNPNILEKFNWLEKDLGLGAGTLVDIFRKKFNDTNTSPTEEKSDISPTPET